MKIRKNASLLLALSLVLTVLAGCGSAPASSAPATSGTASQAASQTPASSASDVKWPTGTINVVNPSAAGGETDVYGRIVNRYLEKELGATFVTTNMAGGGGTISTTQVANAKADGSTMLVFHNGFLLNNLMGLTKLDIGDFEMAGLVGIDPTQCFFARGNVPYDNIKEMVDYLKAGNKVKAGVEVGSFVQFQVKALEKAAGVTLDQVDAGTTSDKIAAMLAGNIDLMGANWATMKDYVAHGDVKCLGVLADERNSVFPDVPTFKEQGYDIVFDKFTFMAFPKGTDKGIVDKFNQAITKIAEDPAYQEELAKYGSKPTPMTTEELTAYMQKIKDQYKALLS